MAKDGPEVPDLARLIPRLPFYGVECQAILIETIRVTPGE